MLLSRPTPLLMTTQMCKYAVTKPALFGVHISHMDSHCITTIGSMNAYIIYYLLLGRRREREREKEEA